MMKVGSTSGCNISRNCILSHILFVDDVLYIEEEKYSKWVSFHKLFEKFGKKVGLFINKNKNEIISDEADTKAIFEIASLFG